MKNEIVAIDLGSNSFRVLKFDTDEFKIVDEYHQVVGLADGLVNSGKISKEAAIRVVNALKTASSELEFNPKDAVCVTTAAMRKAENSSEILEFFKENSGADFKIIDSNEEARLTLLAIKTALKREKLDSKKFILLDIGGGSTELTISNEDEFFSKSFDFGIVTLTQNAFKDKDLLHKELKRHRDDVKEFLNSLEFTLDDFSFVATAGTPTTLAAIKLGYSYFDYDKDVVNGSVLDINDLEDSLKLLRETSFEHLINIAGKGRIEFLEVGTYIYKMFFEVLEKRESIVFDDGLREGVAIDFALKSKA